MRPFILIFLVPVFLLICSPIFSLMPSADSNCTIVLGTDPEPPDCVENPGGVVSIFWSVEYSTTADYVYYCLRDPDQLIVEEETYPGISGSDITREWTVPTDAMNGAYWVRVEYWSVEVGLEGVAEVVFLVCEETTLSSNDTWGRIKQLLQP